MRRMKTVVMTASLGKCKFVIFHIHTAKKKSFQNHIITLDLQFNPKCARRVHPEEGLPAAAAGEQRALGGSQEAAGPTGSSASRPRGTQEATVAWSPETDWRAEGTASPTWGGTINPRTILDSDITFVCFLSCLSCVQVKPSQICVKAGSRGKQLPSPKLKKNVLQTLIKVVL